MTENTEKAIESMVSALLKRFKETIGKEDEFPHCSFALRGVCTPNILDRMVTIYAQAVARTITECVGILTNSVVQISEGDQYLIEQVTNTFRKVFSGQHEYSPFLLQSENDVPEWQLPYLSRFMFVFDNSNENDVQVNLSHDLMKLDETTNTFNVIDPVAAAALRTLN